VQVSPFPLWSDADLVVYLATESAQLKLTRCTSSIPAWNTRNYAHCKYRERPSYLSSLVVKSDRGYKQVERGSVRRCRGLSYTQQVDWYVVATSSRCNGDHTRW